MKLALKIILILLIFTNTSCEENALLDYDKEDTDASLWFEARMLINAKEYQEAIDVMAEVSDELKLKRENIVTYASAHAGLCGLDLLDLVNESDSLGARTPLAFLMDIFKEPTAAKLGACQTAIDIIEDNVSDQAFERNEEENIAMMAILMAQIGSYINFRFDANNDDVIDVGHNGTCATSPMPDNEAAELGSAVSKMFASASELTIADVLGDIREKIDEGCDGLSTIMEFCNATDPSVYTSDQIRGVRSLLQEGEVFGIGSCTSTPKSITNCICL